jgi:RHS repeat-associated protein
VKATVDSIVTSSGGTSNTTAISQTLETEGNNLLSEKNVYVAGTQMQNTAAGFTINGTVAYSWTGTIPQGSRMNFIIRAGNVTAQATPPAPVPQANATAYVFNDHLGTPREIVAKTTGQSLWKWESLPFGESPAVENPNSANTQLAANFQFNLRFPGQYMDAETGLHQNWFRDYDPKLGRYTQVDPLGDLPKCLQEPN